MIKKKAQSSIEFMVSTFLVLLLFGIAVWIYGTSMEEANALRSSMEANRICAQVSATLSSLASSGGATAYRFSLPAKVNGENYTVYVVSARNLVKVDFANRAGVGCGLPSMNITNSTGASFFALGKSAYANSSNGVVRVA